MAIANHVATGSPIDNPDITVTGYIVYNGSRAFIVPTDESGNALSPLSFADGVLTAGDSSNAVVEVDSASIVFSKLNLQQIELDESSPLTADRGTIVPSAGYDGIGAITITSVKLETPSVFTPEESDTAGVSTISKTDGTAWGLTDVQVNKIVTETKSFTPTLEGGTVERTSGKYLTSVSVAPVPLAEATTVTPTKSQQVVEIGEGNLGIKGVTVEGYVPNLKPVTVTANDETQTVNAESEYDGIGTVTVNPVPVETKDAVTPTREGETVEATDGHYFKSLVINGYTPVLQNKEVAPSDAGSTVTPDADYDGLGQVTVSGIPLYEPTAVTPNDSIQTVEEAGKYMKTVTVNAVPVDTNNVATPSTEQVVLNAETGKYFKSVTVSPFIINLQDKTVAPEEAEQTVTADAGYDGLGQVTVSQIPTESKTVNATKEQQVVTPTTAGYYLKEVTIEGYVPNVHPVIVDELKVGQIITTEQGYDGISTVTVNGVKLEDATVKSTTSEQTVSKTEAEAWGINQITVSPINLETKAVSDLATDTGAITASEGYDAIGSLTVQSVKLQDVAVQPSAEAQLVQKTEANAWGLGTVTVNKPNLDESITVKSGVTDVTYNPSGSSLGYKKVEVTGDSKLVSGNIRKGVEILGVAGSYGGPEAGTDENGYIEGEWVECDLPESITRSESFRTTAFHNDHYLGKTFDGGDYMAIAIYSRCGKVMATVMLNDILGKYYLEKIDIVNPFPVVSGTLTLEESVDSSEIDWSQIYHIKGNGNTISVSEPIVCSTGFEFIAEDVDFITNGIVDNPFTGTPKSMTFRNCRFNGFATQKFENQDVAIIESEIYEEITQLRTAEDKYLIDSVDSSLYMERCSIKGVHGVRVSGGEVLLRANTFATTGVSIDLAEDADSISLEGNIFNNTSGSQLRIEDEFTAVKNIHLIGTIDIEGDYVVDGTDIVPSKPETPVEPPADNADDKVIRFFDELNQEAISNYLIENKDAVMTAFGVTEDSSVGEIGTLLYNKLQNGDTVTVNMNDGGILKIYGHFYEPDDDLPYWDMNIEYEVPAGGTSKCFPAGSTMSVKGGKVLLNAFNAEMTSWGDWYTVLLIYAYDVTITDVTVVDGDSEYVLNMSNFIYPYNYDNPCIIDPDSSTWEIYVRQFFLPPAETEATITADDTAVEWKDIADKIQQ